MRALRWTTWMILAWCPPALADTGLERLLSAPVPKVEYKHTPRRRSAGMPSSWATVSHNAWVKLGGDGTTMQEERLDLSANSLPFNETLGLTASVQLTALQWSQYGNILTRFRPGVRSQLYVWEAELMRRQRTQSMVGALGRVLPWYVPGVAILDGAQAGYRVPSGRWEFGAYGGVLPEPMVLGLGGPRSTVGMYVMHRAALPRHAWLQTTARVSYTTVASNQSRYEVEARWSLTRGRLLHIDFSPRVGVQATAPNHVDIEALRFAASSEFAEKFSVFTEGRWSSYYLNLADGFLPGQPGALRAVGLADVSLRYHPSPSLTVAATSYYNYDGSSAQAWHVSSGPEIILPRLYGKWGGAQVSYLTEQGTAQGQAFAVQTNLVVDGWFQALVRGWLWQDVFENVHIFETGAYGRVDVPFSASLSAQFWVMFRHGLRNPAINQNGLANLEGRVQLTGELF